ncbi:hypothetical protein APHAL10511_001740 [Amanita phalloides]|nr:hypothetical protein APHAL10511_001740 [Amanita phalloides]
MDENEELDLDTLQAQIDMSMSFAQDLVSSWIQPSKVISSSRVCDLEKELKEYMRRPARLGVGASFSDMNIPSNEVARLKGKLCDKGKKKRTEESMSQNESDDPEESKARIIRKRAKQDPFSRTGNASTTGSSMIVMNTWKERVHGTNVVRSHDTFQKSDPNTNKPTSQSQPNTEIPVPGPKATLDVTAATSERTNRVAHITNQDTAGPDEPVPPKSGRIKSTVLNLDGPPVNGDEERVKENGAGRRKKRKRRKKK